eukprot:scaffold45715_cov37-Cyclotella_meneghiniana.AAC.2
MHTSMLLTCAPLGGMWGILRKPMPVNITMQKISSLVLALCKLHNFCIDNASVGVERRDETDILNIAVEGGLFLPRMDNNREFSWEYNNKFTKVIV